MSDVPIAATHLMLRCSQKVGARPPAWCGQPARYLRAGSTLWPESFYCDAHRGATDVPLVGARRIRRVRVTLAIDLAGVTFKQGDAHTEAVERLLAAVEAVGGVANLLTVGSAIVQNPAELPAGDDFASGGRG